MFPDEIKCLFCTDLKGIITRTNIGWAHLTCVNWMPEIWFTDQTKMEVRGNINHERKELNC
jgi:hypothetical protein